MPNLPSVFFPFQELGNGTGNIAGNDSSLWINNGRNLYLIRNEEMIKIRREEVNFTGTLLYRDNQLWIGNYEDGLCQVRINKDKILSARYFTTFGKTKIKVHTITCRCQRRNMGLWQKRYFLFSGWKAGRSFQSFTSKWSARLFYKHGGRC